MDTFACACLKEESYQTDQEESLEEHSGLKQVKRNATFEAC